MRGAGMWGALLVGLVAATTVPGLSGRVATAQQARTAWVAYLSSEEEVPRNASRAWGIATFELASGGSALTYSVAIYDIQNVMMGHIHIGAPGQNGPVAVWLYPSAPPPRLIPGAFSGTIASGTITAANFAGGPLAGQPFGALLTAINNGTAYVNFHTSAFPGGEIRGQIR